MLSSNNLLIIDELNVSKIAQYEINYTKIYGNAQRNMNGDLRAVFIGVFPKIKVKLAVQSNSDAFRGIVNRLNRASVHVKYYDFESDSIKDGIFYSADYTTTLLDKQRGLVKQVAFTLIPYNKR